MQPLNIDTLKPLTYFQYQLGFYSRTAHEKNVLFMYYILKLPLNTQNDEKNMYLALDPENLCKIQGPITEPQ